MADRWINYLPLYGIGADINIVIARRNVGKTFTAVLWGCRRFLKDHNRRFVWVRRTDEEIETVKDKFFNYKILRKLHLTRDQVQVKGDHGYIRVGGQWHDCVEFRSVSGWSKARGADDPRYTLLFFDEAFATNEQISRFHGDEVTAFIDLFKSRQRDHALTAILMGNDEAVSNLYLQYFGVRRPRENETIIARGGTFAAWHYAPPRMPGELDKDALLFGGTPYYEYLLGETAKNVPVVKTCPVPRGASYVAGFDCGPVFSLWRHGRVYYVRRGLDADRPVFVNHVSAAVQYYRPLMLKDQSWRLANFKAGLHAGLVCFESRELAAESLRVWEKARLL